MLAPSNPRARLSAAEAALATAEQQYAALDAVGRFHAYGALRQAETQLRQAQQAATPRFSGPGATSSAR